jgi:hypothetical protein
MANDWIAKTEAARVAQAQDFSTKISATPAAFGLLAGDATQLASDVLAWSAAYELATDPATRTKVVVQDKSTKEAIGIARMRSYGKRITANLSVTDAQKVALGLNVRNPHPTPRPAPATRPVLSVVSTSGQTLRIRMTDELTPTKKAKPPFVTDAEVFYFIGENPPADLVLWHYEGQATRSVFDLTLPGTLATGTKVWIAARWTNGRGEAGAVSTPVSAVLISAVAEAA